MGRCRGGVAPPPLLPTASVPRPLSTGADVPRLALVGPSGPLGKDLLRTMTIRVRGAYLSILLNTSQKSSIFYLHRLFIYFLVFIFENLLSCSFFDILVRFYIC